MFYGSVLGSYACESFGTERLQETLPARRSTTRFELFRELTHLDSATWRALRALRTGELFAVLAFSVLLSGVAIAWSWSHGALLNYGDAAAHLHIARRVFDAHQPRFSELGVWMELAHRRIFCFCPSCRNTVGGRAEWRAFCRRHWSASRPAWESIDWLRRWMPPQTGRSGAGFLQLPTPNLLYLQTTAMTEPLFVCEMIPGRPVGWWSGVRPSISILPRFAGFFGQSPSSWLPRCSTRYDGLGDGLSSLSLCSATSPQSAATAA